MVATRCKVCQRTEGNGKIIETLCESSLCKEVYDKWRSNVLFDTRSLYEVFCEERSKRQEVKSNKYARKCEVCHKVDGNQKLIYRAVCSSKLCSEVYDMWKNKPHSDKRSLYDMYYEELTKRMVTSI